MAKTVTWQEVEEYFSTMTKEQANEWFVRMGLVPDPTKIDYKICSVIYEWYTMCRYWEETPKHYDGGHFCGGIETMTYTHPIIPERDIIFTFDGEKMIDCYSVLRK